MALRIVCSGHLVRLPLGGHTWHHLQYLLGLARLGHDVYFVEEAGWTGSCYDPERNENGDDPSYGLRYVSSIMDANGLSGRWCFVGADGTVHGAAGDLPAEWLHQADLYLSLSNMNSLPEAKLARRRALVDTDPVFTQIGGHGMDDPARFDVRFTYGENVGRPGCDMPTGGLEWLPTRQPVVPGVWSVSAGDRAAPLSTVMNWSAYGDLEHGGRVYGQKDREMLRYAELPHRTSWVLELAVGGAPPEVIRRLRSKGWQLVDPGPISRDPFSYQRYLQRSAGEFGVAKQAYVSTHCGWFSDRTCGYLASGRPAVVQDTGFSDNVPCGAGLLPFRTPDEAATRLEELATEYDRHSAAARALVEEHFDSGRVLTDLLTRCL